MRKMTFKTVAAHAVVCSALLGCGHEKHGNSVTETGDNTNLNGVYISNGNGLYTNSNGHIVWSKNNGWEIK